MASSGTTQILYRACGVIGSRIDYCNSLLLGVIVNKILTDFSVFRIKLPV